MVDGTLWRLFWRVADQFDDLVTLAWLRILDALAGPLPETPTDRRRERTMGCDQPLLIIEPRSNDRENQFRRAHSASSHERLPSGRLCSGAARAALHSNPDTWDTRSCPAAPG